MRSGCSASPSGSGGAGGTSIGRRRYRSSRSAGRSSMNRVDTVIDSPVIDGGTLDRHDHSRTHAREPGHRRALHLHRHRGHHRRRAAHLRPRAAPRRRGPDPARAPDPDRALRGRRRHDALPRRPAPRSSPAAGDVVEIAPGVVHGFANAGDDEARVRVEVRPALEMEEMFAEVVAMAEAGRMAPARHAAQPARPRPARPHLRRRRRTRRSSVAACSACCSRRWSRSRAAARRRSFPPRDARRARPRPRSTR